MAGESHPPEVRSPSRLVAISVSVALAVTWCVLRLALFEDVYFPLTFVIPLLVCVWTRSRTALGIMGAVFAVAAILERYVFLPPTVLPPDARAVTLAATLVNIAVGVLVVHLILQARERLEGALRQAREAERQVRLQAGQLADQNDELATQAEELSQQAEELSAQSEELAQQNEELQAQTEEIQALNDDLASRGRLLQRLLDAAWLSASETDALQLICKAGLELFTGVAVVATYERKDDVLTVRAAARAGDDRPLMGTAPLQGRFAELVLEQNRTAALPDTRLRPDLSVLAIEGTPPFLAVLATPLRSAGKSFGVLSVYSHDVREWTDQEFRLAEWLAGQCALILNMLRLQATVRRRAALVDLSPDAIIVRHLDGRVTFWSQGAQTLYGYGADEAIGRPLHELLRTRWPLSQEAAEQHLRQQGHWSGELVHSTRDGREVVVASRWQLERGEDGQGNEILESNVDVTARARAEEALQKADAAKSEFIATLSHELRNPLAALSYAFKLLDRASGAERERARKVIERQLAHLVRLVDDLLDTTRIASNKLHLRVRRVDVGDVVRQAVEAASPGIEAAGHSLSVHLPDSPVYLEADPDRLAQVLTNLLNNAARYTPAGGRVDIATTCDATHVTIVVADTGIGIPEEDRSRVFEMFTQLSQPGQGGLGIGLALVKAVVDLHGGTVEVRDRSAGGGSEFVVSLPRATRESTAAPSTGTEVEMPPRATRRILVVDDNHDAAEMMKAVLELDGHVVEVSHDGGSALSAARTFRPDIALLDIGLPDVDGYELARRLRAQDGLCDLRVIAVTGWGQEEDRRRARENGFDGHLTKPADPDAVSRMIAALPGGTVRGQAV